MSNFRQRHILVSSVASLALLGVLLCGVADPHRQNEPTTVDLAEEIRHRLAMLPSYSVFDYLSTKIEGSTVILTGQVVHPRLKSDAEAVVKKVKGVTRVQNAVELLPTSSSDDRIRQATYRAIYVDPALSRYRYSERPMIRIIVERGGVSLEGAVYDQSDVTVAGLRAKSVPNVSSVRNNLGIQGPPAP
jgi:osmotically-inducible protein OsmY